MAETFGSIAVGYTIGCINPSYIIGRIKGFDIRKSGSGNAGGSNALIVMGKLIGFFCMIIDILKAYLALKLTEILFGLSSLIFALTSVAIITGHIFPIFMRFKGGKGLASLGGIVLYYSPLIFAVMLVVAIIIVLITDYICFVPLSASAAFPITFGALTHDVVPTLCLTLITLMMWIKHIENLKRIKNGTEIRISYLWHKDREIERVTGHSEN